MDRGKGPSGRGGKSKTPQFPADLYALGSKAATEIKPRGNLPQTKVGPPQAPGDRERKREGASMPAVVPSKKAKIAGGLLNRQNVGGSSPGASGSSSVSTDAWESLATDLPADGTDFASAVLELESDDQEKIVGYLCGAIKQLKNQKSKPDPVLFNAVAYLAKVKPEYFVNEHVSNAVLSILSKKEAHGFKNKGSNTVLALAVNVLMVAYEDVKRWPESFLKVYMEDAGGERAWVDMECNKPFVENIITSLNTKPITSAVSESLTRTDQTDEDIMAAIKQPPVPPTSSSNFQVLPRYKANKELVEAIVMDIVKEQLSRRQSIDLINRNFLRLLTSLCGIADVRLLVASRLEAWLQNPKLMRPAQELLMSLCVNSVAQTIKDYEMISYLIKMRLKTKALGNYYLACIKELVAGHQENLGAVLKHSIYNELSTSRNPNNMAMLAAMFQFDAEQAAFCLAGIFHELLLSRDDFLRHLRALLREMARVLRAELRLPTFCRGLVSVSDPVTKEVDAARAFYYICDLISLSIFLTVMPHAKSEKKDPGQIAKMHTTIANIQSDAIRWLQDSALHVYRPSAQDYLHAAQKVLLLEPAEQYYKVDMWPPEQDRATFMRLATDSPVLETTLLHIFAIGLSKEHPLTSAEALDIGDQLVRRAATVLNPNSALLKIDNVHLVDFVFNMCAYRHPENIDLPTGYKPPSLAISALYWKAWTLLLILASHNPGKLGEIAWEMYPTLRVLMEMCITSHFIFPPCFDDLQLLSMEKQTILEFETHLAAASTKMEITEESSLLLSQLVSMDPSGPPRKPPPAALEIIMNLNTQLRLGHLLCRSRKPDFLLDIIHRQGASQTMPWLADLVHNSEGALNHLPVQCLCEFLLSSGHKQEGKYRQLLMHLSNILTDPDQDPSSVCEVLEYFLRRLSTPANRGLAIQGLKQVITPVTDEEVIEIDRPSVEDRTDTAWLTKHLPLLPHFKVARPQIVTALRLACQVENDPNLVTAYLCFLAKYTDGDSAEINDLVLDMAQLIVERSTIMGAIVPSTDSPNEALDAFLLIFYNYLTKSRAPRKEGYTWCESQDQVRISWPNEVDCTAHILVVHAMVILLTYGPNAVSRIAQYEFLLETWFPTDIEMAPKGYLVDTSEEALLIPDWLKLRMIRSHVPRLVEAALMDLDITQLILFIQSFGIPIASMSKLLATLDTAVLADEQGVGEAVLDKTYMIQLVEVQHRRGATGGDTFTRVLDQMVSDHKPLPASVDIVPIEMVGGHKRMRTKQEHLTGEGVADALEKIFGQTGETSASKRELFRALQRTLVSEIKHREKSVFIVLMVRHLLKSTMCNNPVFIRNILSQPQFSCPLFRLLMTLPHLTQPLMTIANSILKQRANITTAKPLITILQQFSQKAEGKTGMEERMEVGEETSLSSTIEELLVKSGPATGHLVDKLVRLEPEILGSSVDLQMQLLFSTADQNKLQFRPYLLTLLTHHASWKTLSHCMDMLLLPESVRRFDPSFVLDFLKALTCNPKLWQGREKHTPKHYAPEDVLNLKECQLVCMVDYTVEEARTLTEDKTIPRMTERLQLLTQCVRPCNISTIMVLAQHLVEKSKKESGETKHMCNQLLVQLYMKVPSLVSHLGFSEVEKLLEKYSALSVNGTSVMDVLSHTLLTALCSNSNAKDWSKRSQDLELSVRKMAATHPLLVLRQLALIASSLKGRVDLDWNVFKSRNHLLYFQQVSSLLDLLQPAIFHPEYTDALNKTLDCFIDLFLNHGRDPQTPLQSVTALVTQFAAFFQNYTKKNYESAKAYLQSQAEALSELQADYPPLTNICVIVSGLRGTLEVMPTPNAPVESGQSREDKIGPINKDDPVNSLNFLDYSSTKRPAILTPHIGSLCTFLTSPIQQARSSAHTMVARYLRYNPKFAPHALPSYVAALTSSQPDVVASALERLPEVVVASQELALQLLRIVFSLGMKNNLNTLPCIAKTLSILNLQSAC